jgi:hypothetical protein
VSTDRGTRVLDLHGLLSVALLDAAPGDVDAVRRQLGPLPETVATLSATPASGVTIRFVDRLEIPDGLRPLGRDAAFGDEAFVIVRGRRKTHVRVRIPVERIGSESIELVAERGLRAVPYLLPIVNLALLARGHVPVHASAFVADGFGTLVTGWAKGGKTEALLAFADHGATYVGDEWVYVTADGASMTGLPEPMRVWDWQLAMVPRLRDRIGFVRRARLGAAAATARAFGAAAALPAVRSSAPGDAARRLGALAENQQSLQVPPERVFDGRVAAGLTRLDAVVMIESSGDAPASVEPIAAGLVARRAAATVAHELLDLQALYLAFRYAFPDRANPAIESLAATVEMRLAAAFADKPCVVVRHPSPPDIPALHGLLEAAVRQAMRPGDGAALYRT